MDGAEAFRLIARAIDAGSAAHGYLVVGDVRGNAAELVEKVLRKLFPDAQEQVAAGVHPDVVTLEPEGKKRIITIDSMRSRIVVPMSTTSFSGGWKVGIISGADRFMAGKDLALDISDAVRAALAANETHLTLHTATWNNNDNWNFSFVTRERAQGPSLAPRIEFVLKSWVLKGTVIRIR